MSGTVLSTALCGVCRGAKTHTHARQLRFQVSQPQLQETRTRTARSSIRGPALQTTPGPEASCNKRTGYGTLIQGNTTQLQKRQDLVRHTVTGETLRSSVLRRRNQMKRIHAMRSSTADLHTVTYTLTYSKVLHGCTLHTETYTLTHHKALHGYDLHTVTHTLTYRKVLYGYNLKTDPPPLDAKSV